MQDKVIIRLHGGCGNQIFQLFYAMCFTGYENIYIYFDRRYDHNFELAAEFKDSNEAYGLYKIIISTRMVKILEKLKIRKSHITILNKYMDGYFQDHRLYLNKDTEKIRNNVRFLKEKFKISSRDNNKKIYHIRLGDFFLNRYDKIHHAKKILNSCDRYSDIITTDDRLFQRNYEIQKIILDKNLNHILTENMSGNDLLRLISGYKCIDSNASTLAFWAAVLGSKELKIHNTNLQKLYTILNDKK